MDLRHSSSRAMALSLSLDIKTRLALQKSRWWQALQPCQRIICLLVKLADPEPHGQLLSLPMPVPYQTFLEAFHQTPERCRGGDSETKTEVGLALTLAALRSPNFIAAVISGNITSGTPKPCSAATRAARKRMKADSPARRIAHAMKRSTTRTSSASGKVASDCLAARTTWYIESVQFCRASRLTRF